LQRIEFYPEQWTANITYDQQIRVNGTAGFSVNPHKYDEYNFRVIFLTEAVGDRRVGGGCDSVRVGARGGDRPQQGRRPRLRQKGGALRLQTLRRLQRRRLQAAGPSFPTELQRSLIQA